MPRTKTTARPAPEGEPPAKRAKKASKHVIETTSEHYMQIDKVLGYTVFWNAALNELFGYCAYTQKVLPYIFFPVLTREPDTQGQLPREMTCGDIGYFAGGDQPSTIRLAIIEAFGQCFPDSNPKKQQWKQWQVYKNNCAYYGTQSFEGSPETSEDLAEYLNSSVTYAGSKNHNELNLARVCTQKKYLTCVSNESFFAKKPPVGDRIPVGKKFPSFSELMARHDEYEKRKATLLEKKSLKKKVSDASEEESSSDSE